MKRVEQVPWVRNREDPNLGEDPNLALIDLFWIIWSWLWLVVTVAISFAGVALGYSFLQPPEYETSVKLLVGQEARSEPIGSLPVDSLQQVTQTLVVAVDSRAVAEEVIQQLDLEMTPQELLNHMSVQQVDVTQFIEVSYVSGSPESAQRVANTIGDVFSQRAANLDLSANKITVEVYERALAPTSPVSPNPIRNCVLAFGTGLMVGVALVLLLEYLGSSKKSVRKGKSWG